MSPKKYMLSFNPPRTSGCDLIWKRGLHGGDQVKIRSWGGPLSNMVGVLTKRATLDTERDTHRGGHVKIHRAKAARRRKAGGRHLWAEDTRDR